MDAYEHNELVYQARAAYHLKRCQESEAYKRVYDYMEARRKEIAEQNLRLVSAITGQPFTPSEKMEAPVLQPGDLDILLEMAEKNREFDARLIKKSCFEW